MWGGRFDREVVGEAGMGRQWCSRWGLDVEGGHSASPGAACWSEVTQLVAR